MVALGIFTSGAVNIGERELNVGMCGRLTTPGDLACRPLLGIVLALAICPLLQRTVAAATPQLPAEGVLERLVLESGDELIGKSLGIERGSLLWQLRNQQVLWVPLESIARMDSRYDPAADKPLVLPAAAEAAKPPASPDSLSTEVTTPLPPGPDTDAPEASWFEAVPFYTTVQQGYVAATDSYTAVTDLASTWTRRFTFGGQFNDGNSQTDMFNLQLDFEHSPPKQLRQFELIGQIGRNQGVQSTNRWNLNSNFDWPLKGEGDDKWIAFATTKNEYDGLADLDYRGTLSSGVGYRFFNDAKKRLILRCGPGYTIELFEDDSSNRQTLDMFAELETRWPLKDKASLEHKIRLNPSVLDIELVRIVSTSSLLIDIDDKQRWKLRLGFNYTYISEPNPGRVPADYTSTISLMYTRK